MDLARSEPVAQKSGSHLYIYGSRNGIAIGLQHCVCGERGCRMGNKTRLESEVLDYGLLIKNKKCTKLLKTGCDGQRIYRPKCLFKNNKYEDNTAHCG